MKIPKPWRVAAPIAEPPLAAAGGGDDVPLRGGHYVTRERAIGQRATVAVAVGDAGSWILQAKVLSILAVYQMNEYRIHIVGKLGDSDIFIG